MNAVSTLDGPVVRVGGGYVLGLQGRRQRHNACKFVK